jgi:hypothetical protein
MFPEQPIAQAAKEERRNISSDEKRTEPSVVSAKSDGAFQIEKAEPDERRSRALKE